MLPSLLLIAVLGVRADADLQFQQDKVQIKIGADEIAVLTPPASAEKSRRPFARLFRETEKPKIVQPEINPGKPLPQTNPRIECGLLVWRVDERLDPKIRLVPPRRDLDPKIAVRPPAPCTKNK